MGWLYIVLAFLLFVYLYPYIFYRCLKLKRYNLTFSGIAIQHWVLNTVLVVLPTSVCAHTYQPTLEVSIATQAAYWIPVCIMRYIRKGFTFVDRIWVYAAYPFIFVLLYGSIYLYIDLLRYLRTQVGMG
ncbi:hypothetical protein SAMN02745866_01120 [Alteromonadaceae bacterium Bs31]|nr:hypothetical protein SAMN02745866_01120 [Alteromonadaceae bacterium Bs31]